MNKGHVWTNFAGDQSCRPAVFERPGAPAEVAEAIGRAAAAGRTVRVAGAGHSFTDGVLTDGTLLSLERMNRVLDIDPATGLVRVEAGISLGALSAVMYDHGLAFANLGDIDVQSIAGATGTGTHGTGMTLPNLSAGLKSIQLALADGSILEVGEGMDPDAWRAARVSMGALGVVTAVTLQAVPAFTLSAEDTTAPLETVLRSLDERVDSNDHFGFFAFPHSELAMTKTWNRTSAAPRPRSRAGAWCHDVLLTNHAYLGVCLLGRARRGWIPALNRLASAYSGTTRYVDRSYRVFATPRRVPLTEMEYAIPREYAAEAVRTVMKIAERREFDVPAPLEVRFVASDDAYLSPAGGRGTCYIAVHQFAGIPWEQYFRTVEQAMIDFGGRPHWGKRHFLNAEMLRRQYPHWDRFQAVRARLDPHGVFTNDHIRRVLGRPVGAGEPA
ncbi:D-arabinono-1,4-lactone oxidase [Streptomyces sp. NBC_00273]|uniref:D-arabinono-1,4-lactone oxidase n=1 Tax=Streptomyces sp. NBC_00273 TaxID=2903644 RepID=UPI002E28E640|nr:D-arabinono-1,4-lactone oxidase [Streptomyces sp. NBC_00273]